jgi:hypothetical protein
VLPLRTARDVRRAIAKIVNECRAGQLAPKVASTCLYGCNIMLAAITADDFEQRIAKLEGQGGKP